jgi:hypothetical protein
MGLVTKVANSATNQRYIISTVRRMGAWQTAAFKRRLGPLSAFCTPALVLNALEATHAAAHHDRVATIVRDVHPTNWEKAKRALLMEDARACGDIRQILELGATASFAEDLAALNFLVKDNAED